MKMLPCGDMKVEELRVTETYEPIGAVERDIPADDETDEPQHEVRIDMGLKVQVEGTSGVL